MYTSDFVYNGALAIIGLTSANKEWKLLKTSCALYFVHTHTRTHIPTYRRTKTILYIIYYTYAYIGETGEYNNCAASVYIIYSRLIENLNNLPLTLYTF